MIPTPLTSADVPAGALHLWVPTADSLRAWTGRTVDPRRPGYDQDMRVREDPDGAAPVSAWIGLRTLLGPTTGADVAEMLTRFTAQHESLRSSLALVGDTVVRRTLAPYELRFEGLACGALGSDDAADIITKHFFRVCRPTGTPPYAFATVETASGTYLYAAFDHVTFDGLSAYNAVAALAALHAEVRRGDPVPPALPSYADVAEQERAMGESILPEDPRLAIWRAFLADGRSPAAPHGSGVLRGAKYDHILVSQHLATADEASRVTAHWRERQVNSGVLWTALLLEALTDPVLTTTTVSTMISTHNRPSPAWLSSMGWFAGVAPLQVPVAPESTITDWIEGCARAWRISAAAGTLALPFVASALSADVEPTMVLSLIDASRIMGHERWTALEGRIFLGDVAPSGQIHVWLSLLPDGAYLSTRLPLSPGSHQWIEDGADRLRRLASHLAMSRPHALTYEDAT